MAAVQKQLIVVDLTEEAPRPCKKAKVVKSKAPKVKKVTVVKLKEPKAKTDSSTALRR